MEISSLQTHILAVDMPLEQFVANKLATEQEKVEEMSRQFEAMLLRQILEQAQKKIAHTKYDEDSTSSDIYKDMVTHHLADSISQAGTFGLARSLNQQLVQQLVATKSQEPQP